MIAHLSFGRASLKPSSFELVGLDLVAKLRLLVCCVVFVLLTISSVLLTLSDVATAGDLPTVAQKAGHVGTDDPKTGEHHIDPLPGAELAQTKGCLGCHGHYGGRAAVDAPFITGQNRDYMMSQVSFIESGARIGKTNEAGQATTEGMKGTLHHVSKSEISVILDYFSSLKWENTEAVVGGLSEAQMEEGRHLFTEKKCIECHGVNGKEPISKSYPLIGGQRKSYLKRQIENIKGKHRTTGVSEIMVKATSPLTDQQIDLLASYLSEVK